MAEEFKLVVDVEANLSKLDSTLAAAQQKVSSSATQMQKAMTFSPTVGGSGPLAVNTGGINVTGPTPSQLLAQAGNARAMQPTGGVAFGGNLQAVGGNAAKKVALPSAMAEATAVKPPSNFSGLLAEAGLGSLSTSLTTLSAYAAAVTMAIKAQEVLTKNANTALESIAYIRSSDPVLGARGIANFSRAIDTAVSDIPGGNVIVNTRNVFQSAGRLFSRNPIFQNLDETASAIDAAREEQYAAEASGKFGREQTRFSLEIDRRRAATKVESMKAAGASQGSISLFALNSSLRRSNEETRMEREFDFQDREIESRTRQARLQSMGLAPLAQIEGIQNQFMRPLDEARRSKDKDLENRLLNLQSANLQQAFLSNSGMAQETNMGMSLSADSVRAGTGLGQSEEVLKALRDIAANTAQTPTPAVAR